MSTESAHILVIDDDPDIAKAARLLLERRGMTVAAAPDPEAAWIALARRVPDCILLDLNFARGRTDGREGFAMLDRLLAVHRDLVVIVVTGHSGIAVAVEAMRGGASDFVIKPWNNERLLATVERGIALSRARASVPAAPVAGDAALLGECPAIRAAHDRIARIAATDASVLLIGAAGTGKTLAARLLHRHSGDEAAPAMLDGEAFDPAAAPPPARTIILDHVDRVPRPAQPALARALADRRVIATTRLDRHGLRDALTEELLYRVGTIEIALPPLAERGDDIAMLARHFLALFAHRHGAPARPVSPEAMTAIVADAWPDNVRGLRQAMERAVLLGDAPVLTPGDFALSPQDPNAAPRPPAASLNLARSEEALVQAALKRHAFNISRAAADLGLTRAALYRRMARYGL